MRRSDKNNEPENRYPVRKSALISPWGIGAIVPVPSGETFMVAGTEFWFDGKNPLDANEKLTDFEINDFRLSERLAGMRFVQPPEFLAPVQDREHPCMRIPATRFPRVYYCPVCGNVEKVGSAQEEIRCPGDNRRNREGGTYCSRTKEAGKKTPLMVPERFIAVCENGHIEDFPIAEWGHRKSGKTYDPKSCLMFRSTGGNSASLTGVRYTCTCGASASMKGAFDWDEDKHESALSKIGCQCAGNSPWLGTEHAPCDRPLRVIQRGASNVWFPDIVSSIFIPELEINAVTRKCIKQVYKKVESQRKDGRIDEEMVRAHIKNCAEFLDEDGEKVDKELAFEKVMHKLGSRSDDAEKTENDYRKAEYDVLIRDSSRDDGELQVRKHDADEYEGLWYLKSLSLVSKLRETRVLTGFRRLSPQAAQVPLSASPTGWLPAVKNEGEGLMFCFDTGELKRWANRDAVTARVDKIRKNIAYSSGECENINPIYVLIHTFAHCLISALSIDSGYSAASIRERIYCPKYRDDNAPDMAGVLIYTASGDSEGSLGGLVRQGKAGRIEEIIRRALHDAEWCSADPVCMQSNGQGIDGANLAACHNCALLPETSCENRNMLLDRGLLVGTLEDKMVGFFNHGIDD